MTSPDLRFNGRGRGLGAKGVEEREKIGEIRDRKKEKENGALTPTIFGLKVALLCITLQRRKISW